MLFIVWCISPPCIHPEHLNMTSPYNQEWLSNRIDLFLTNVNNIERNILIQVSLVFVMFG